MIERHVAECCLLGRVGFPSFFELFTSCEFGPSFRSFPFSARSLLGGLRFILAHQREPAWREMHMLAPDRQHSLVTIRSAVRNVMGRPQGIRSNSHARGKSGQGA